MSFGGGGLSAVTAADWRACLDPEPMVLSLPADGFQQEFRLFALACARRVWHLLPEVARAAVEGQERFISGRASAAEADALLVASGQQANAYYSGGRSPDARAYAESA